MSDKAHKLTRAERKYAQLVAFCGHLLSYPTVVEAAKATGISSRTATRWLHSAEFQKVYVANREATLANVASMLRQSSVGAVEALAAVIRDPEAPATAKTNAARAILDNLLHVIETEELERRIKQIEAAAGEEQSR